MQYQKEDVRNRIVDAAKTEFLRVGFYRASMLQISNRAHVPIGNLYRYFASKASLFDAIVGTAKERIIEGLESGMGAFKVVDNNPAPFTTKALLDTATVNFLELAKNYQKELILLLQKSGGSEHDGFMEDIIARVKQLLEGRLTVLCKPENKFLLDLVAENVTRGAFRIMIECPHEEQHEELVRLLVFYFNHLEDRLY
ncbi:MAG: TetR/AcrR family transcriptional regulator [Clostridia bacterium]|nr:TetR/AcrR family transcriptional regulator [Clostridia bacterium]